MGNEKGQAFRDLGTEDLVHKMTQSMGIGAQFGGKYFCHDVRVIRLPRHSASCPIGIGVSCSADRQCEGKITSEGIFVEALERDPAKYLPNVSSERLSKNVINIDLNQPMNEMSANYLSNRLKLDYLIGTLIVARDSAHAKLKERMDAGRELPQYFETIQFITLVLQKPQMVIPRDPAQRQQDAWIHVLNNFKRWRIVIMLTK